MLSYTHYFFAFISYAFPFVLLQSKVAPQAFPPKPKNFAIGNDVYHKADVSRFVRWPRYIRIQRQKKVIYDRLKVPPAVNQFTQPLDRAEALPLFKLLTKYAPEDKKAKKERLVKLAEAQKAAVESGKEVPQFVGPKPVVTKFGLNHVTHLVENKQAKLVVIASDVDPIELVIWLPTLCRKMGIPYVIVNNKGRLGQVVHQKKAAVVAFTEVKPEDEAALQRIIDMANAKFVNNTELRRKWGGGNVGLKTQARLKKRAELLAIEAAKRAKL